MVNLISGEVIGVVGLQPLGLWFEFQAWWIGTMSLVIKRNSINDQLFTEKFFPINSIMEWNFFEFTS